MPMYDYHCKQCGFEQIDVFRHSTEDKQLGCPNCAGGMMDRRTVTSGESAKAPGVIDDSIPGGILIKNGICNDDGTPKRYYSHTEIRKAAEAKHMVNKVEHIGARGSDKNKNTVRWI